MPPRRASSVAGGLGLPTGLSSAAHELINAGEQLEIPPDMLAGDDTEENFDAEDSFVDQESTAVSEPVEDGIEAWASASSEEIDPHDWEADVERTRRSESEESDGVPNPAQARSTSVQLREDTSSAVLARKSTEFALTEIAPIPEIPEPGFISAAKYSVRFTRARWQRGGAINRLRVQIRKDTTSLDSLFGTLGMRVRDLQISNRDLEEENRAIDAAEKRWQKAENDSSGLGKRRAEENSRFAEIEADRTGKLNEAKNALERAQAEYSALDTERREIRDQRKELERQYRNQQRAANDREAEATRSDKTESRVSLRRVAEQLRHDAAKLEPKRQELDRHLSSLDRPFQHASVKTETLRKEVDALKRALQSSVEQHRRRLEELESEQSLKNEDLTGAQSEIRRRLVTLGTLVNLNRIDREELNELYGHIDIVHTAIAERSEQIETLTAERSAYHRPSLIRGLASIAFAGLTVVGGIIAAIWAA